VPAIPQLSIRFILQGRPQRPVRNSFYHLVGAGEQRRDLFEHHIGALQERFRNGEAYRLRSLEIDGQLELRGLLNG
jgi:hypothetical protein